MDGQTVVTTFHSEIASKFHGWMDKLV